MRTTSAKQANLEGGPGARALRQVKQWMAEGSLVAGERMPAEETLAKRLGVARTTIRRVLRDLERQGMIIVEGRRRTIASPGPTEPSTMTQTIAMLAAPRPVDVALRTQPGWSHHIYTGVADAVRTSGLHLLELAPERLNAESIARLARERVRGLVVFRHATSGITTAELIRTLRGAGLPVVVYGYESDVATEDTLASDHDAGAYKLTKLLIERGCRRILRLWSTPSPNRPGWIDQRDTGYERALREAALPLLPPAGIVHPENLTDTNRFEVTSRLMVGYLVDYLSGSTPIDGICTLSDGQAYAAGAACRRLGKIPGKDILIAGYDNYWREAQEREHESCDPIATIDKRNYDIGQELVKMLLQSGRDESHAAQHRLIDPQLVVINDASLKRA